MAHDIEDTSRARLYAGSPDTQCFACASAPTSIWSTTSNAHRSKLYIAGMFW